MNTFKNVFKSLFESTFLYFFSDRVIQQFYVFIDIVINCNSGNFAIEIFYSKSECTVYKVSPRAYQLGIVLLFELSPREIRISFFRDRWQ